VVVVSVGLVGGLPHPNATAAPAAAPIAPMSSRRLIFLLCISMFLVFTFPILPWIGGRAGRQSLAATASSKPRGCGTGVAVLCEVCDFERLTAQGSGLRALEGSGLMQNLTAA
jgi:hypothetical protein